MSADEELSLSGIKLTVPLWVLLVAGALLSLGVSTMFWSAYVRANVLSDEAVALYRRAGYEVEAPTDSDRSVQTIRGVDDAWTYLALLIPVVTGFNLVSIVSRLA